MKNMWVLIILLIAIAILLGRPCPAFAQKSVTVDLTSQYLYAYENGNLVYSFPVSTGKIATPTPTGGFWPWIKLRTDTMRGGSNVTGDYYYLPNVPYVIYFYNAAYPQYFYYALHGTYWHNNFGHPMSHGCVNVRTTDMEKLYYWIDTLKFDKAGNGSGTVISIRGTTPSK